MHALFNPLLTLGAALAVPAVILVLALWLEDIASKLGPMEISLLAWFPALIFAIGIGVALRFNRLRILAALFNLLLGYAALAWFAPTLDVFERYTLLGFLFLLLPLNHLACHVLPEHAAVSGWRLLLLITAGIEAALFALVAGANWESVANLLQADMLAFADPAEIGLADTGFITGSILLLLSFARLYASTNVQRAALFVSACCLLLVLANHDSPETIIAFATGGALILAIAGFQESWNIAYLDQLTELPGRRALDEALARLEGRYAIAMLDVDHFKKFNDTYGHDVGDQVLRMVAAQMREAVSGKAYRYGGEEFTLLFPGRNADEALSAVDALREAIGRDTFEIRRRDRRNGGETDADVASVTSGIRITVSAGVAECAGREQSSTDVVKAADEALYKAKHAGRNCVRKAAGKGRK